MSDSGDRAAAAAEGAGAAAVFIEDERRRMVLLNRKFCELFGLDSKRDDLVGSDSVAVVQRARHLFADPEAFVARLDEILAQGQVVSNERIVLADHRVVERDYVPILMESRCCGHLWQYRDVTHQVLTARRLEESESRYRVVAQTAHVGIVSIDDTGIIEYANPAMEGILGYSPEDLLGQPVSLIVPPSLREAHAAGFKRYLQTRERRLDWAAVKVPGARKDGSEVPLEISFGEFHDESGSSFTGVIRDATESTREKEHLVGARQAAEEASQAKSDFLTVMSHEIRTPLHALVGTAELAMDTATGPEQVEYMGAILRNSEVLLSLVNNVLDFSKIEAGQMDVDPTDFDLWALAENVVTLFAVPAAAKGLTLTGFVDPDLPRTLIADPGRLRQILVNLLANAIKFTDAGEISLEVIELTPTTGGAKIRFTVSDTGIGIAAEDQESVFDDFVQSDSSTQRRQDGSGLGLSISRALAELMEGEISLESELGTGSCFHVDLPLRTPDGAETRWMTVPQLKDLPVLLAARADNSSDVVRRQLEACGCSVTSVTSSDEALEALHGASSEFAVVILDLASETIEVDRVVESLQEGTTCPPFVGLTGVRGVAQGRAAQASFTFVALVPSPVRQEPLRRSLLAAIGIDGADERTEATAQTATAPRNGRVLVVDDNRDSRRLTARFLQIAGYDVSVVSSAAAAVEQAVLPYDLILMDLRMPDMDGLEATRRIREQERLGGKSPVLIVALTADAVLGVRAACIEAGMNDYLTKPLRRDRFLNRVARWVPFSVSPTPAAVVKVDPELLDLLPNFIANCRADAKKILLQINDGDFRGICRIGHNLKGSGSGYGFEQVSAAGESIERAAEARDIETIRSEVDRLRRYLAEVRYEANA